MKLLIKLNFSNDNVLFQIIDSFYENIYVILLLNINKDIILNENNLKSYENLIFYREPTYPINDFINSNVKDLEWDVILTSDKLFKPIKKGFDEFILNNSVKDIMWWKDDEYEQSSIFSIKRDYYDKNGYILNPIYNTFDYSIKEFKEISSILKNSMYMQYDTLFELVEFDEDKYVYDRRKKFNFTLLNVENILEKEEVKEIDVIIKPSKEFKNDHINNFVNKIYCINLDRRSDRWEHMKNQFARFNINVERFSAVDGKSLRKKELKIKHDDLGNNVRGAQGALKSHRAILKEAIDRDYDRIAVFEDDIIFCDDFIDRFDYYANVVPKDWDIMYLGCHYNNSPSPKMVRTYIYKNERNFGCFAMILNKQMIRKIYELTEPEEKTIDDYISTIIKIHNVYCFIPFFVKTIKTVSDISTNQEEFEYEIVNKHFSPKVLLYKVPEKKPVVKEKTISSESDILGRYLSSSSDFYIYKSNMLIFDSKNNRQNIRLYKDYFEVYGRRFSYMGINVKSR